MENNDDNLEELNSSVKQGGKKALGGIARKTGSFALRTAKGFGMGLLKAAGSSIIGFLPVLITFLLVFLIGAISWYYLFETKGTEQKYTYDFPNQTEVVSSKGYAVADKLNNQNNMIAQFYQYFSKKSYWQILGNDNTKITPLPDKKEDQITDYYGQEATYSLSPNFLYSLDEYLFKGKAKYPEQFIKPINYDPSTLTLKSVVDSDGFVNVDSTVWGDSGQTSNKDKTVGDFGLASIFKYKTDNKVDTIEGTYTLKDVWDDSTKSVIQVSDNESFNVTMSTEQIHLMTNAVTFAGEFKFNYVSQKLPKDDLIDGKTKDPKEPKTMIYYDTYYEQVDTGTQDPLTGEEIYQSISHELYKYRSGKIYETLPTPTAPDIHMQKDDQYIKEYLDHFTVYLPESVMRGFDFNSRVGQFLDTKIEIGSSGNTLLGGQLMRKVQQDYGSITQKYADEFGTDPQITLAQICRESKGDPMINKDGLLQIEGDYRSVTAKNKAGITETFSITSEADRQDPDKAIHWGVMELKRLMDEYNEQTPLKALQAYNFGEGTMQWITDNYKDDWESFSWLNDRQAAQDDYLKGGGDPLYVENVMAYYNGSNSGLDDLTQHDQQSGWEAILGLVKSFFTHDYKETEKYVRYDYSATAEDIDFVLDMPSALANKQLYSEVKNDENLNFWDDKFGEALQTQGISAEGLLAIIPGYQEFTPPLLTVKDPIVSSPFGMRHGSLHTGIDLAVPIGTPVYATENGEVEIARTDNQPTSYGNYIQLKHSGGVESIYAHLSQVNVKVGENVARGQLIGISGNSGGSTGPHLHFELRKDGKCVDPALIAVNPNVFVQTP